MEEDAEIPAEPAVTSGEDGPMDRYQPISSAPEVPSEAESEQTRPEPEPPSELLALQLPLDRLSCVSLKVDQNQAEEIILLDQHGLPLQCERMMLLTGESESREVFVMPSNQLGGAQVLLPRAQLLDIVDSVGNAEEKAGLEGLQTITLTAVPDTPSSPTNAPPATQRSPPKTSPKRSQDCFAPLKRLPSSAPNWAQRLRNAEKIGDSYRGYCASEAELETIILLHKQQTGAVFGTRQSPSQRKPATRLMWKSQYVPYDGIPFVNAGSRAMVMECQYGPRRKGLQPKKTSEHGPIDYKATCPARIYIKKVRKFPEYGVPTDPKLDKHVVRQEQEKAFSSLRRTVCDGGGVLRYYMQLPTQKAHLYHDMDVEPPIPPPPPDLFPIMEEEVREEEEVEEEEELEGAGEDGCSMPSRLHPRVVEKINELVAQGHQQVYAVRKQLRTFVEREMFNLEEVPERHNLCFFPTVNDIKNHIHEAQKALQLSGTLSDTQWDPLTETVTLMLTPAPPEGGVLWSVLDGADTLSPEAVQLFSSLTSLQPKMFAQLQGVELQPVPMLCSSEGPRAPSHTPSSSLTTTDPVDPPQRSPPQPLLDSPSHFLHTGPSLCKGLTLGDPSSVLGQVVSVPSVGERATEGGARQILFEDEGRIEVGAHQTLRTD